MAKAIVTAERLREVLDYNRETGAFINRQRRGHMPVGVSASSKPLNHGYSAIQIDGTKYLAHRLAWLYCFGVWPTGEIDHINGNRLDNAISNLRDVSRRINQENLREARGNTKSGTLGVYRSKDGKKWAAMITVSGKFLHLGVFETIDEASAEYLRAKRKMHEGCTI